jgi:predicted transcriptional regulator
MKISMLQRWALAMALGTALGALAVPIRVPAEEASYWPEDEDDKELKKLDNEVLRLQKARFQAIFAEKKDDEEIKRIQKKFKEAQSERHKLLRKTGRY